MTSILILAKTPVPGSVKTRLCPPCTPTQAAAIAEACIRDTVCAATAVRGARTTLVLDGPALSWLPDDVLVIPQRAGGLDRRIAGAFADTVGPAILIGMDTPQVTSQLLTDAIRTLWRPGVDAVLGEAADGGWWAAGLRRAQTRAFDGVSMGTATTGAAQRRRFASLGLHTESLPVLRDVDTMEDAHAVAHAAPLTRFARAVWRVGASTENPAAAASRLA